MFDAPVVPALHDEAFVGLLRKQMLHFAMAKLDDAHLAEDVVQEALMGAFVNAQQFAQRAALRTWVFGILKHKISDAQRTRQRQSNAEPLSDMGLEEASAEGVAPHLSAPQGLNPAKIAEAAQFERVLGGCMGDLTPQQAEVFGLRTLKDVDPATISQQQGIGIGYVHVLLHRARAKLRHCLEHHWRRG